MIDRPNEMKRVASAGNINLHGWTFCDLDGDKLSALMAKAVTETLREVFERNPPELSFAYGHSKKDPSDPATMYVGLPLTAREYESVYYACSLEGAVDDVIELLELDEKEADDEDREVCGKLAARLRELADKLDRACAP